MQSITVALDAMGGDFGPRVTVPAAVQALSHFPELKVILIGDQALITSQLYQLYTSTSSGLAILHSEKVISNSEKPSVA
ncbi:phosphate acyltransferase, partial [Escherichia coli]|nr:phosphate acyltransferase [Escherichia coli]